MRRQTLSLGDDTVQLADLGNPACRAVRLLTGEEDSYGLAADASRPPVVRPVEAGRRALADAQGLPQIMKRVSSVPRRT